MTQLKYFAILSVSIILASCSQKGKKNETSNSENEQGTIQTEPTANNRAEAILESKSGSKVKGTVEFKELDDGTIMYTASVTGLEPNTVHAMHIHEIGDCSTDDGSSAGGHWNPTNHEHGKWGEQEFHLGDIGNLVANDEGVATLSSTTKRWSLIENDSLNIIGHSIIVHEKEDDFTTQPTGNAGGRIACGIIN